jgi:hypothetical protein
MSRNSTLQSRRKVTTRKFLKREDQPYNREVLSQFYNQEASNFQTLQSRGIRDQGFG